MCIEDVKCIRSFHPYMNGYSVNIASIGFGNTSNHSRSSQSTSWIKGMSSLNIVYPIINENNWKANHQTLVVVFCSSNASEKFIERSSRFVTSFNSPETIKADILSLCDNNFYLGLTMTGSVAGGRSVSSVKQFAKEKGYAQLCILQAMDDE